LIFYVGVVKPMKSIKTYVILSFNTIMLVLINLYLLEKIQSCDCFMLLILETIIVPFLHSFLLIPFVDRKIHNQARASLLSGLLGGIIPLTVFWAILGTHGLTAPASSFHTPSGKMLPYGESLIFSTFMYGWMWLSCLTLSALTGLLARTRLKRRQSAAENQ
jgi:hypothetical protein